MNDTPVYLVTVYVRSLRRTRALLYPEHPTARLCYRVDDDRARGLIVADVKHACRQPDGRAQFGFAPLGDGDITDVDVSGVLIVGALHVGVFSWRPSAFSTGPTAWAPGVVMIGTPNGGEQ